MNCRHRDQTQPYGGGGGVGMMEIIRTCKVLKKNKQEKLKQKERYDLDRNAYTEAWRKSPKKWFTSH